MADSLILGSDDNRALDPMQQAVKSYKDAMRPAKQDLNVEFLIKTLDVVNGASALKVARNPIKNNNWNSEAKLHNVRGFVVDDNGRLTVRLRGDSGEFSAERALDQLDKLKKKVPSDGHVMLEVSDGNYVQITDMYSHAFVKSAYAGLPFDVVLGYFEKDDDEEE